eukprot:9775396-Karenia_brevis.AAC.1
MVALIENCDEFNLPLWTCALDYQKAFDSVSHSSLWRALRNQGVPICYVSVLARLYKNQTGRVVGQALSKPFSIDRGTKQGDPISPNLFNSVLEDIVRPLQQKWRHKGYGINVDGDLLCNLRFADD